MGNFASVEEARAVFRDDKYAAMSGITLDSVSDEEVVCSMEIDPELHCNAYGGVMGGAIFTLGDFAFAVATNNAHRPTVALSVSINFTGAPKGRILTARARCVKDGRTTCVYDIDITDDTGRHVAQFVGTGFKKDA